MPPLSSHEKALSPIHSALALLSVVIVALTLSACRSRAIKIPEPDRPSSMVSQPWIAQGEWLDRQQDGDFLLFVQRFDKAEEAYRLAFQKAESFGAQDPRLARSLTGLARVLMVHRDWENARIHYQRAINIKRRRYGILHADIADLLTELALTEVSLGRADRSILHIKEAKEIWKRLRTSCPNELVYLEAVVAVTNGKTEEAGRLYKLASTEFLDHIDLNRYPQSTRAMRFARECIDQYCHWLDSHGRPGLAKAYRARVQPVNEWLMLLGESGA